jgi:hypothetical protein
MEPKPSEPKSNAGWADLDLPVPDASWPLLPALPLHIVYALNDELVAATVYDEEYFAQSLAHKNPARFEL